MGFRGLSVTSVTAALSLSLGAVSITRAAPLHVISEKSDHQKSADLERVEAILSRLESSPSGAALLKRARHLWNVKNDPELARLERSESSAEKEGLGFGAESRTDAVLIRRFDQQAGEEHRERKIHIVMRRAQTDDEALLDLAHELVHATSRPDWDPYDPALTAGQYVESAIEGKGGEIEAVTLECQVGTELELSAAHARCDSYQGENQSLGRQKLKKDFYQVGRDRDQIITSLGAEASRFPELSAAPVILYSSTGRAPYPLSLLKEFKALTRAACANMRRILVSAKEPGQESPQLNDSHQPNRAPATSGSTKTAEKAEQFIARRCTNP